MVNPDYRYTPDDDAHFEGVHNVTIGMTEVLSKMTIEYNLGLMPMIREESQCIN